jgi:hypothetical protein
VQKKIFGKENLKATIASRQLQNVKYLKHFINVVTDDAKCALEIKRKVAIKKAAFNKMTTHITSKLDIHLGVKLVKHYICSTAFYCAENWKLRNLYQKHLENSET